MDISTLKKRSEVKVPESPIETKLATWFQEYQLFPQLQYEIGPYRADIVLLDKKIVVECDGREFHTIPEQRERDRVRDMYMRERKWIVERFTGSEIYRTPWLIVQKIMDYYYPRRKKQGSYEKYWEQVNKQNILARQAMELEKGITLGMEK